MAQHSPHTEAVFVDPKDKFWSLYLSGAETEDEVRIRSWNGDTDGILIFTGLFAATVAAFVIESYKTLSPDTGVQTVALLGQLLESNRSIGDLPNAADFEPPATAVVVNSLWFLSLIISLVCALSSTLVQQWARRYLQDSRQRRSLRKRGPIHVYLSTGINRYGLNRATLCIVTLLHIAVSLFLAGLLIFLFPINPTVAWASVSCIGLAGFAYLALSALSAFDSSCPYHTPLTPVVAAVATCALFALTVILALIVRLFDLCRTPALKGLEKMRDGTLQAFSQVAEYFTARINRLEGAAHAESCVELAWECILQLADETHELEMFFDGLIPILESGIAKTGAIKRLCVDRNVFDSVSSLLLSCRSPYSVSETDRARRIYTAFYAARLLLEQLSDQIDAPIPNALLREYSRLITIWRFFAKAGNHGDRSFEIALLARMHATRLLLKLCPRHDTRSTTSDPLRLRIIVDVSSIVLTPLIPLFDESYPHGHSVQAIAQDSDAAVVFAASVYLSFVRDIFFIPETVLQRYTELWLSCFEDIPDLLRYTTYSHPPSAEFIAIYTEAGLEAWLHPEADFSLPPASGPQQDFLHQCPQLLTVLRTIARLVVLPPPRASTSMLGRIPSDHVDYAYPNRQTAIPQADVLQKASEFDGGS